MTREKRMKELIAGTLAHFLLPEKIPPEHIDIHVSYQQSLAHLRIEAEKIKQIFCEEARQ